MTAFCKRACRRSDSRHATNPQHFCLHEISKTTRKFKQDIIQESWQFSVNYRNLCYNKSMKLSSKKEILTRDGLHFFESNSHSQPNMSQKDVVSQNAEQTLLKEKQYRPLAISGCTSRFLTHAWNDCLLNSYHIIVGTIVSVILHCSS